MPTITVSVSDENLSVIDRVAHVLAGSRSSAIRYILSNINFDGDAMVSGCGLKEIQVALPLVRDAKTGRFKSSKKS